MSDRGAGETVLPFRFITSDKIPEDRALVIERIIGRAPNGETLVRWRWLGESKSRIMRVDLSALHARATPEPERAGEEG